MAEINTIPADHRKRPGVRRSKKHSLRTDMTPMVDLGFLLITFFVFTAEMSKPASMDLIMPKESATHATPPGESNALTILLDKDDELFYYHGKWQEAQSRAEIHKTNFSPVDGLRKIIREKQQKLASTDKREGKDGLMLLIKAGSDASYKNVIDALDEALINGVKKYAIIKPTKDETDYISKQ